MIFPPPSPLVPLLRAAVRAHPEHAGAFVRQTGMDVDVTAPSRDGALWAFEQLRPALPGNLAPGPVVPLVQASEDARPLYRVTARASYQLGLFSGAAA